MSSTWWRNLDLWNISRVGEVIYSDFLYVLNIVDIFHKKIPSISNSDILKDKQWKCTKLTEYQQGTDCLCL